MTEENLQESLAVWQKRLRLQDWDVVAHMDRYYRMGDSAGHCTPTVVNKYAKISISVADDYSEDTRGEYDPELYLVHELLHLHFAFFMAKDKGGLECQVQEQAIHALAHAFVNLSREGIE